MERNTQNKNMLDPMAGERVRTTQQRFREAEQSPSILKAVSLNYFLIVNAGAVPVLSWET